MSVLLWHVHGSWTGSFVAGRHRYLIPELDRGGPWGLGRAGRDWPPSARAVPPRELAASEVDVVVLQRPEEPALVEGWLGRRPGVDVPAVYVEHNAPPEHAARSRHPLAGRADVPVVHVTGFNELMWDCGDAPVTTIPHGIADPGHRWTGELPRAVALINEPVRRGRVTGSDLLPRFGVRLPVDVCGIGTEGLTAADLGPPRDADVSGLGDLPQDRLHATMARRRLYLHTARWTSLGLSLLEAMALGMPVVVPATTEAAVAVPPAAGVVATSPAELVEGAAALAGDPARAADAGAAAREHVLTRFGLPAFLKRWDELLGAVVSGRPV
ncbi:glycosyltransferase [Pseudonocardia sp. C8]|uniref:glycosyltransferase n=1 Tax=Pseudonocardia sp. C8 TaxID=2762759 RepID=UPI0016426083|nr:glycosyltransferase [Pseudonocardia sp. C8]MBC3192296.1 glycosyltransferase [Pseudonocardia sp. C8]